MRSLEYCVRCRDLALIGSQIPGSPRDLKDQTPYVRGVRCHGWRMRRDPIGFTRMEDEKRLRWVQLHRSNRNGRQPVIVVR